MIISNTENFQRKCSAQYVYTHRDREEDNKNFLPAKIKVYMWEKS